MDAKIEGAQNAIGYHFKVSQLLWEALSAPGTIWDLDRPGPAVDTQRRLALLGDAVIKLILIEDWYPKGDPRASGSTLVATVASNRNLDRIGRGHGIDAFLNLNPSQAGIVSQNTMADAIEAIIGAVYHDGGISAARTVMNNLGLKSDSSGNWYRSSVFIWPP